MKEDLIHLVWKMKKFNLQDLKTAEGETILIKNFGFHNHDAGPDFLNAEIKIGDKTWHGSVEMHVRASEWQTHKHQHDKAYNNVILHVVYKNDKAVYNANGLPLATLVLENRITQNTIYNYDKLKSSLTWVPCANQLKQYLLRQEDKFKNNVFLERLLVERLETKSKRVLALLDENKNDWEDVLYKMLVKYLGLKVNGEAFAQLTKSTPYKLLLKTYDSILKTEALLMGQAGILEKGKDEYVKTLKTEYDFLKHKHQLTPMSGVEWKFSRMRPVNFPSIRIAQIASLYHTNPQLFNSVINIDDYSSLIELLKAEASTYWDTHYIPGKESKKKVKKIGAQAQHTLIINAIVPIIFAYGIKTNDQTKKDLALKILESVPSEKNKIIENWDQHGILSDSAGQSQALLELKSNYCDQFKCLNCNIGRAILFS